MSDPGPSRRAPLGPTSGAVLALGVVVVATAYGTVAAAVGGPWTISIAAILLGPLVIWRVVGHRWRDLGLERPRLAPLATAVLVAIAVAAAWPVVLGATGLHDIEVVPVTPAALLRGLVAGLAVGVAVTALFEELVFRGALLHLIRGVAGSRTAITLTALLFAAAHLPTLLDRGVDPADIAWRSLGLAVWSFALAVATLRTGRIWIALGWHAGANLGASMVGVFIATRPDGPAWLAGGFGAGRTGGLQGVIQVAIEAGLVLLLARRWTPALGGDAPPATEEATSIS